MNDKNQNDAYLEPYLIALKMEQEGQAVFLDAAKNTSSEIARQTFEFLAKEEDKHIKKIEEFYNSLKKSGGKDIIDVGESDADDKLEEFFLRLENIKDEFKGTDTDREAYEMALSLENGAEEFYEEMFDKSTDPGIKKFYKWLMTEESMHSRLINSCIKFVDDPSEWFRRRKA